MIRRAFLASAFLAVVACGGSPTEPQPQPIVLTGTWTGTLSTSNYSPTPVVLQLTQNGGNVTGTWATTPAVWSGSITGMFDGSMFSASFSITATGTDGATICTANASVTGPVERTGTSRWTGPGFGTGQCVGAPVNLVWEVRR